MEKYIVSAKALILKDGKILVLKTRRSYDGKIDYVMPGGMIERDETPKEALRRELKEELNLDIEPILPIYVSKFRHPKGDLKISVYYLCKVKGGNFKLGKENDQLFLELEWIDENTKEIPDWLKKEVQKIKENLKKIGWENFESY